MIGFGRVLAKGKVGGTLNCFMILDIWMGLDDLRSGIYGRILAYSDSIVAAVLEVAAGAVVVAGAGVFIEGVVAEDGEGSVDVEE
jgi:hypothetical protein